MLLDETGKRPSLENERDSGVMAGHDCRGDVQSRGGVARGWVAGSGVARGDNE